MNVVWIIPTRIFCNLWLYNIYEFGHWSTGWPDARIKEAQSSTKCVPKVATAVLLNFSMAQKVAKYFGSFCYKICSPHLSK